jgi:hypothetical protein
MKTEDRLVVAICFAALAITYLLLSRTILF